MSRDINEELEKLKNIMKKSAKTIVISDSNMVCDERQIHDPNGLIGYLYKFKYCPWCGREIKQCI